MADPIKDMQRLGIPKHAQDSVSRSFGRILKGSDGAIRTDFLKDKSPEEILKLFEAEVWDHRGDQFTPRLLEIELANRSKFGSRSAAVPWAERKSQTRKMFEYEWFKGELDVPELEVALYRTLRPLSVQMAADSLPNSTSSGLPFMRRKSEVRDATVSDYEEQLSKDYPAVLGTRTQEGGKTRDVSMWPFAANIREARVYRAYLDSVAKKLTWRSALRTPESVDKRATEFIQRAQSDGGKLLSIDFSAYDQSLGPSMHKAAFEYVRRHFQAGADSLIDVIAHYFTNIGLLTPSGLWLGQHGVPSGSVWTNEVDSIVQYLIYRMWEFATLNSCEIQGDDGLYYTHDPEGLMSWFSRFNLAVNEDKSLVADTECVYLQKYYSPFYFRRDLGYIGGIYSVYRALTRLVFMERWVNFDSLEFPPGDYFSLRAISIIENAKFNPLFERFVRFVQKYDERSLTFNSSSKQPYAKLRATERGGLSHNYGDGKFEDFHTMKVLAA